MMLEIDPRFQTKKKSHWSIVQMRLVNSLSVRDLGPISSITVDTKLMNIVTGLESNQELLFLAGKTMLGHLVIFLN